MQTTFARYIVNDLYSLLWQLPVILIVCYQQHHEFSKVVDHYSESLLIARQSRRVTVQHFDYTDQTTSLNTIEYEEEAKLITADELFS